MWWLFYGCGPVAEVVLEPEATPVSEAYARALLDGDDWVADEAARVGDGAAAALAGGGAVVPPAWAAASGFSATWPVVEADPEGVTLATGTHAHRLLVRLDAEAPELTVYDDVWVGVDGARVEPGAAGVLVRGGAVVEVAGGRYRVELGAGLEGSVVVLEGDLARRWVRGLEPDHGYSSGDAELQPGTPLRDEAGGVLAHARWERPLGVRVLERRGADVLVEAEAPWRASWLRARGWVPAGELHPAGWLAGWGWGGCAGGWCGGAWPDPPAAWVPEGTLLYDLDRVTPVGVLLERLPLIDPEAEAGVEETLWTPFGEARVWVPPAERWGPPAVEGLLEPGTP